MTDIARKKSNFRNTKAWQEFRDRLHKERKIDPVTGSRLVKRFNLHHKMLTEDIEKYMDLTPENFECLNPKTHDLIHQLFEMRDWRKAMTEIQRILEDMERLSK